MITDHVRPSIEHTPPDQQYRAPARECPVCGAEQAAGYVRCDRRECRTTRTGDADG